MNRILRFAVYLPLLLLLSGFFWSDPTWEEVNRTIDRKYPAVRNINTESLKTFLDQGKQPILVDVREKDEFAVSHLPTAVNITEIDEVPYPTDLPIVVYCSVGVRSANFAKQLGALGFTEILNLRGSIFEWANKGYPLMRGNREVGFVHPYNSKWGKLLKQELHQYQVTPPLDTTQYPSDRQ
jgi:rhodanese-related sulfurtransferase